MSRELMKGSIDILLLSEIKSGDKYGYEIVQSLKKKSSDTYQMSEGTLYPVLKRLERKGLLTSYWGHEPSMSGRRKYYQITESGMKKLDQHLAEWNKINKLMQLCMGGAV
ncbi:PadR family transcriptional regulator [Cohnella sp. 56]|uniref:PadR family transcriptional regulator n=1 Tax=Cohnella sp. 56 TaxID=3113722 RepID=UPI0030E90028